MDQVSTIKNLNRPPQQVSKASSMMVKKGGKIALGFLATGALLAGGYYLITKNKVLEKTIQKYDSVKSNIKNFFESLQPKKQDAATTGTSKVSEEEAIFQPADQLAEETIHPQRPTTATELKEPVEELKGTTIDETKDTWDYSEALGKMDSATSALFLLSTAVYVLYSYVKKEKIKEKVDNFARQSSAELTEKSPSLSGSHDRLFGFLRQSPEYQIKK